VWMSPWHGTKRSAVLEFACPDASDRPSAWARSARPSIPSRFDCQKSTSCPRTEFVAEIRIHAGPNALELGRPVRPELLARERRRQLRGEARRVAARRRSGRTRPIGRRRGRPRPRAGLRRTDRQSGAGRRSPPRRPRPRSRSVRRPPRGPGRGGDRTSRSRASSTRRRIFTKRSPRSVDARNVQACASWPRARNARPVSRIA